MQSGRVNFGVFSTSRFVPSALSSDFFTTMYFSSTLLRFSLTFHFLFRTFVILLGWILLREYLFLENNIPDLGFLGLSNAIYMKLPSKTMKTNQNTLKNHGNQPKTMKNQETTLKNHGN